MGSSGRPFVSGILGQCLSVIGVAWELPLRMVGVTMAPTEFGRFLNYPLCLAVVVSVMNQGTAIILHMGQAMVHFHSGSFVVWASRLCLLMI